MYVCVPVLLNTILPVPVVVAIVPPVKLKLPPAFSVPVPEASVRLKVPVVIVVVPVTLIVEVFTSLLRVNSVPEKVAFPVMFIVRLAGPFEPRICVPAACRKLPPTVMVRAGVASTKYNRLLLVEVTVKSPCVVMSAFAAKLPDCEVQFQIKFPNDWDNPVGAVLVAPVMLVVDVAFQVAVGTVPPFTLCV